MKALGGIFPVVATPFTHKDHVDEGALRRIVRYVLAAGAHGVTYPAVASEFNALSENERMKHTGVVIEEVDGAIPVIVGASASSTETAVELSRHAQQIGAAAIMLMAPPSADGGAEAIQNHYEAVANVIDVPIVLQNAPPPLGSAQPVESILKLLHALPHVRYVKEENQPCGQRMTRYLDSAPASLLGVFGGAGGRYILDELNRSAIGAMPACELTELHVQIYERFVQGKTDEARNLFNRILPLLNFQAVFRMHMTKEVLRRRGIIECANVRAGGAGTDRQDLAELQELMGAVDDLLIQGEEFTIRT